MDYCIEYFIYWFMDLRIIDLGNSLVVHWSGLSTSSTGPSSVWLGNEHPASCMVKKKKKNLVTRSSYLFQVGDMNFPCRALNMLWPLGKEISNKYVLMGQFLNIRLSCYSYTYCGSKWPHREMKRWTFKWLLVCFSAFGQNVS